MTKWTGSGYNGKGTSPMGRGEKEQRGSKQIYGGKAFLAQSQGKKNLSATR